MKPEIPFELTHPRTWLEQVAPDRGQEIYASAVSVQFEKGVWLFLKDAGQFYVSIDGKIQIEQVRQVNQQKLDFYLETVLKPIIYVFNGDLVLHAAAVKIEGKVIAVMGESGAGKSTLISHFLQEGAQMLAEDALIFPKMGRMFLETPTYLKLRTPIDVPGYSIEFNNGKKSIYKINETRISNYHQIDLFIIPSWNSYMDFQSIGNFTDKMAILLDNVKSRATTMKMFPDQFMPALTRLSDTPFFRLIRPQNSDPEQVFTFLKTKLLI